MPAVRVVAQVRARKPSASDRKTNVGYIVEEPPFRRESPASRDAVDEKWIARSEAIQLVQAHLQSLCRIEKAVRAKDDFPHFGRGVHLKEAIRNRRPINDAILQRVAGVAVLERMLDRYQRPMHVF